MEPVIRAPFLSPDLQRAYPFAAGRQRNSPLTIETAPSNLLLN